MVDVDANGKLVRSTQVLTEATFATVQPGMTRDDVLRTIGHPSDVKWLGRQQHTLWSYRYDSPFCVWFQVSLDTAGRVAEVGQGPDPLCEVNDRRRF